MWSMLTAPSDRDYRGDPEPDVAETCPYCGADFDAGEACEEYCRWQKGTDGDAESIVEAA